MEVIPQKYSNRSVRFPLDMVLFPRYVNRQFEPNGSV